MKIINMDKYQADAEDRRMRELFTHPPLADNGFSDEVEKRIRRNEFHRRMLLPAAALTGGLLAAAPALKLARDFGSYSANLLGEFAHIGTALAAMQAGSAVPLIVVYVATLLTALHVLED